MGDEAELAPEPPHVEVAEVDAVEADGAVLGVIQPREQLRDGRLWGDAKAGKEWAGVGVERGAVGEAQQGKRVNKVGEAQQGKRVSNRACPTLPLRRL